MHPHDRPLPEQVLTPGLLVIGGGFAGLSAAMAAHGAGADVLLLIEPDPLPQPHDHHLDRLRARARHLATVHAVAWGAFPGPEIAAVSPAARLVLRPRQLIVAQPPYEAAVPLPGWTLPGCTTAAALQDGIRAGTVPAGRVMVAGSGPSNLLAAARLVRAGAHVVAVVEASAGRPAAPRGPRPSLRERRPAALASWSGLAGAAALARALATVQRGGVPVLWDTRPLQVLGEARVEGLLVAGPRRTHAIQAETVALHWGHQAEAGLARALGVPHRLNAGALQAVAEPDGRTAIPTVFVVDEAGPETAVTRGRAAGLAAARALGLAAPAEPAALRRAIRLGRALQQAFAAAPPDPAALPDETPVCPCERVSAGTVRRAIAEGAASPALVKRATRAGMGHCGGRLCAVTIGRLCGAHDEAGFAAPRLPLRPVPAWQIMAVHNDPQDAVLPSPSLTGWTTARPGPLPASAEVVIVGGGIVGLATALYLARDGADVLLVDRDEPGMAASTANAGSLHIQLVPYVYAAGGGGPMADALPLGPASIALWRELARDANEDLGLRTEGGLVLAETAAELALLRDKVAFERARGIACEVVGPEDLRRIAPNLDASLDASLDAGLGGRFAGAAFCPGEGQGDPLRGTMALLALARRAGVRLAPGIEVTGLEPATLGWRVLTAAGAIRARHVVNAAGVQAGRIGALAGVTVPVHALVQQVVATASAPPMLRQLVAWTGRHLSLKQGDGGHLLVGGGWPGTQDARGAAQLRRDSIEGNIALAAQALPGLRAIPVVRAWTGLAPTLGRAPVITGTPGQPGLWHGVTGNGYTLGPVVGRLLADAVLGRSPPPPAFRL